MVRRLYEEANNERRLEVLDEIMAEDVASNTPFPEAKSGGRRVHLSGIDIDRLDDGRIVEHFSVASMLDVAERLGLLAGDR